MPFLLSTPGNAQAVREAYEATSALRSTGVTGFVLLEIDVREDGRVGSAKAILPPQTNTMFTTHGRGNFRRCGNKLKAVTPFG
jgi:hypothetical protein